MVFGWLERRRRRRILARPFPSEWVEILRRNVRFYASLTPAELSKLHDDLRIFIAERDWEGCGGLALTDEIRVTIAAHACRLILGLDPSYFARVQTILVYPESYRALFDGTSGDGTITPAEEHRLGEAWRQGPVVLSWAEFLSQSREGKGGNLVLHEFAHKLDMLDGWVDGVPPLADRKRHERWCAVLKEEYARLRNASEAGRPTLVDSYGAKNEGEFFAVATETFFQHPVELARRHAALYGVLRDFYRQDPAGVGGADAAPGEAGGRGAQDFTGPATSNPSGRG